MFRSHRRVGFTLIELLIVVGIVAVLAAVVILVLNPAELLKQSRDSNRLSDLATLNSALNLYQGDGGTALGTSSIVSVSVPDSSPTCATLGLPSLPAGWTYRCVTTSSLRNVDGTGWVPVNFTGVSFSKPIASLPIDPLNAISSGFYYTYTSGGAWELTGLMESQRYIAQESSDGGMDPVMYEKGNNLTLSPFAHGLVGYWSFDEGSGTIAGDGSGFAHPGILANGPTWASASSCKVGGCLSFDGIDDVVQAANVGNSFSHARGHTLIGWRRLSTSVGVMFSFSLPFLGDYNPSYSTNVSGSQHTIYGPGLPSNWQLIAGTYDGTTMRLYSDGVLLNSASFTGNDTFSLSTLLMGSGYAAFTGFLDEMRIYSRPLSAAEVEALYNATR